MNSKNLPLFPLCFLFAFILTFPFYTKADSVKTANARIFVNGKPFFIKGICYSPSYPGKGGGALVFKFLPDDIKEKDFRLMKEAGINTLRVYEPMFDDFYQYLEQYNMKVIVPVISPGTGTNISSKEALEEYKKEALKNVRKLKNKPGILMWALWNDAPFDPSLTKKYSLKQINDFFREIYKTIKKEDPDHLITGANMINAAKGGNMGYDFLDALGCNTYLGLDQKKEYWKKMHYSGGYARQMIEKLKRYKKDYNKPVFITETGFSTLTKRDKQAEVIESQLQAIGEDLNGVCLFEWIDEWWKAKDPKTQDKEVEDHWGILDGYRNPKPGYEILKTIFTVVPDESQGFPKNIFKNRNPVQSRHTLRPLPRRNGS